MVTLWYVDSFSYSTKHVYLYDYSLVVVLYNNPFFPVNVLLHKSYEGKYVLLSLLYFSLT